MAEGSATLGSDMSTAMMFSRKSMSEDSSSFLLFLENQNR